MAIYDVTEDGCLTNIQIESTDKIIVLPDYIKKISSLVFFEKEFDKLIIPKTVDTIEPFAFDSADINQVIIENPKIDLK